MNIDKLNNLKGKIPDFIFNKITILNSERNYNETQIALFLAQLDHESQHFKRLQENLNYSANGLLKTFPSYFNNTQAGMYANQPQRIANRAYGNRYGNGDENSGDGWRYRGRGYIQLTFKDNYREASRSIGVDLVSQPDLVTQPEYAWRVAIWYMDSKNIWSITNLTAHTEKINGGTRGLLDRQVKYRRYLNILGGNADNVPNYIENGNYNGNNNVYGSGNNSAPALSTQGSSSDRIEIIFDPTIPSNNIEIDLPSEAHAQDYASNVGYMPFVWYNAYPIEVEDIEYFKLYNDGVIPSLNIIFKDSGGLMGDGGFPLDDTKITIFLNPKTKKLKGIFVDYKILKVIKKSEGKYLIKASLDISELYNQTFKNYGTGTSMAVLQAICKEVGLGFKTNMSDTQDSESWLATGESTVDLINSITECSYAGENSFIVGYIDYHYYFTLVDLEKELSRIVTEDEATSEIGLGQFLGGSPLQEVDEENTTKVFLTNDQSMISSNIYFNKYYVTNSSTELSISQGHCDVVSYYDKNKKQIVEFAIEGNTTDGNIQLKGAPNNDTAVQNKRNVQYIGRMDTDVQNVNSVYSVVQNQRNINELAKITLVVDMSIPNYTVFMCQKIPVVLSNNSPTPTKNTFNYRLSGDYIISNITYVFDGVQNLTQQITLMRRDLSLSPSERKETSNQSSEDVNTKKDTWQGNTTNVVPEELKEQQSNQEVKVGKLARMVGEDSKNINDTIVPEIDTFEYIKNKYQIFSTRLAIVNPLSYINTISELWTKTPKEWRINNSIDTGDICFINSTSVSLITKVENGIIHGVVIKNKKLSTIKITSKTFLRIPN
jgi:putative chitinase